MSSGNSINPLPLINGYKENGHVPVDQFSQPPTQTSRTQPTPRTPISHTPSVKKKGVKDFEFGKTLGEGSYSTVCEFICIILEFLFRSIFFFFFSLDKIYLPHYSVVTIFSYLSLFTNSIGRCCQRSFK